MGGKIYPDSKLCICFLSHAGTLDMEQNTLSLDVRHKASSSMHTLRLGN